MAKKEWLILTGKTHAAAGAATALLIGTNLPQLVLVVAGSLLPDIDHSGSMLGKHIKPVSRRLKHRHLTHSLLFLLAAHSGISHIASDMNHHSRFLSPLPCLLEQANGMAYLVLLVEFLGMQRGLGSTPSIQHHACRKRSGPKLPKSDSSLSE